VQPALPRVLSSATEAEELEKTEPEMKAATVADSENPIAAEQGAAPGK
jgi:hypothetical protein